jgi:cytochrome P450
MNPIVQLQEWAQVRGGMWVMSKPVLVRQLARHAPMLRAYPTNWVLIWRDEHVRRVLAQDRAMAVPYGPRMRDVDSPFFLGLPNSPDYRRLKRVSEDALIGLEDRVGAVTTERARAMLAGRDRFDVIQDVIDPVIVDSIERLLGVHRLNSAEREDVRAMFHYIFIGRFSRGINARAHRGAADLAARLHFRIRERRANPQPADDGLQHMIDGGFDDTDICDSLIGLIAAWLPNVSRATALAFAHLLPRAAELRRAGPDALEAHVLDALRGHTPTPTLERRCERELIVGRCRIKPGHRVAVFPSTAMVDERGRLDADLNYGYGLHRCLGATIATRQIAALVAALVQHGRIAYVGPIRMRRSYPYSLIVEFEPEVTS